MMKALIENNENILKILPAQELSFYLKKFEVVDLGQCQRGFE